MSVCQRDDLQVHHQLAVLLVIVRNRARPLHVRQLHRDVLFFGALNAALDIADGFEILVELALVAGAQAALQARQAARSRSRARSSGSRAAPCAPSARVLSPSPKSRSNTMRGLISPGSGLVSPRHDIDMYAQV